jgi:hypothetical protein
MGEPVGLEASSTFSPAEIDTIHGGGKRSRRSKSVSKGRKTGRKVRKTGRKVGKSRKSRKSRR